MLPSELAWEMQDGLVDTREERRVDPPLMKRLLGRENTRSQRKTATQQHEALKGVLPLRNDLMESDLELVSSPRTAPLNESEVEPLELGGESHVALGEKSAGSPVRWSRFVGRLFLRRARLSPS